MLLPLAPGLALDLVTLPGLGLVAAFVLRDGEPIAELPQALVAALEEALARHGLTLEGEAQEGPEKGLRGA